MMMSISCVIMANLPTYAEIGITGAVVVTGCRIVQGLSSMGEIMGAQIYVAEITKPPIEYPAVAFIGLSSSIGSMAALGICTLVTTSSNWRVAFWIGAGIAMIGSIARTRLRETPDFLDMKAKKAMKYEKNTQNKPVNNKEKINKKTVLAFFSAYCGWPITFYLGHVYFNSTLKNLYGYSTEQIIAHNFGLAVVSAVTSGIFAFLSYRIHPLKILRLRGEILFVFSFFIPFLLINITNPLQLFIFQSFILTVSMSGGPADSVLIKHFPVDKRFTATSFLYALSRALMYLVTSFSLVYLTESFGEYGLWFVIFPTIIAYLWGVRYYEKLEKESGNFPSSRKPDKIAVA
jgi:MFS transporter, MHS family, proline/betaine transporter